MSANPAIFQTSLGPMTAAQIADEVSYTSYRNQRNYGLSQKRLSGLFGEVPCELMESRYKNEQRLAGARMADDCFASCCGARGFVGECPNCRAAV